MHKTQNKRWKKFFSFYKPYRLLFITDILSALLATIASLAIPLCTKYITGNLVEAGGVDAQGEILRMGGLLLLLIVVRTAFTLYYDHMGHVMGAKMERDMRYELFSHIMRLSTSFFDGEKTGGLLSRINTDLLNLAELYHHGPEDLILYLLRFIGAFIILFLLNAKLAAVASIFVFIMLGYALIFHGRLKRAYKDSYERIEEVSAQTEDSLQGIRVTKSFAREKEESKKFAAVNESYFKSRANIYKNEAYYYTGLTDFLAPLITAAVVVFGALAILQNNLEAGTLLAFILYASYLVEPIPRIAQIVQLYQNGLAAFHRFMDIIEIPMEPEAGIVLQESPQGEISFTQVSFRYSVEEPYVLKDLSLHVKAGEQVAVVGTSGVGKTTLCSLIPRFYEIESGKITLDGVDTKKIALHSLRAQIGIVLQEVYLFSGTVLENIGFAKPSATKEEIILAAKRANAHDFIMRLPKGYDTDIGQRGIRLSGGQRQRLSIARVFLKNPPILIFDEATSALDNESEQVVQAALYALAKNRTTFIIAHRLSTIRSASRILVLGESGIEEEGTHETLLRKGGIYAKLYTLGDMTEEAGI